MNYVKARTPPPYIEDNGALILESLGELELAYATTVHKSQGSTGKRNTLLGERIPGLNLMEYAKEADRDGKKDLKLSLEGRKTWFRLVCPGGGLVLNALRVTDANDRNPLASFTATQKADKATGSAYVRATQDAALNEALKNAGFSLRLTLPRRLRPNPRR